MKTNTSKFPEVFPPHLLLGQCLLVLLGLWHEKPTKTFFVPPSPSFLLITSITILCNFRWCESSRVLRVVWSHRVNDDGKPVLWSLGYNEAMETSALARCSLSRSPIAALGQGRPVYRLRERGTRRHCSSQGPASGSLSTSHLCFSGFRREPCLSAGSRVCTFCLSSSLFLGPVQCNFLLPPPFTSGDLQFLQRIPLLFSKTSARIVE